MVEEICFGVSRPYKGFQDLRKICLEPPQMTVDVKQKIGQLIDNESSEANCYVF